MTRVMIIDELAKRGYIADLHTTIKNGVELNGVRIQTDSNVAPIIYTDSILEYAEQNGLSLEEVVSEIIQIYEGRKIININPSDFSNREYVLKHLYVGLQQDSSENIEKRPSDLEGIECYLYIRGDCDEDFMYSAKISKHILSEIGITVSEAWKQAELNTIGETRLNSLAKTMADVVGFEYTEEMDEEIPIFVLSNRSNIRGASAILNRKVLEEFGARYHVEKIVVLPSSIHEMLVMPYTDDADLEMLSEMVGSINRTEVAPEDRLTDKAYIVTV